MPEHSVSYHQGAKWSSTHSIGLDAVCRGVDRSGVDDDGAVLVDVANRHDVEVGYDEVGLDECWHRDVVQCFGLGETSSGNKWRQVGQVRVEANDAHALNRRIGEREPRVAHDEQGSCQRLRREAKEQDDGRDCDKMVFVECGVKRNKELPGNESASGRTSGYTYDIRSRGVVEEERLFSRSVAVCKVDVRLKWTRANQSMQVSRTSSGRTCIFLIPWSVVFHPVTMIIAIAMGGSVCDGAQHASATGTCG